MQAELKTLARDGVLRVAINTGNRALVQQDGSNLTGVSPALAERLAQEIGARMEPVVYSGAGKVFDDAYLDKWDVGFLAIDPMRAEKIAFTRPYIVIEATYAVRSDAPFKDVEDVDAAGVKVLTSTGSAYDMHLTKSLQHAALERSGTPPESFEEFRAGRCDAVAGVRASLEGAFARSPDIRILSGVLTSVRQAMVLPDNTDPRIAALNDFVDRAIKDGFVAAAQNA
ncbi:transporter substrate-binding domain-containing protein [Sulfitobacter sp. S223]|uniref:transporter substrate-binding domain-containing protein n=1 Tax=Sulfitobacter sp. S223 TaxID=2867023 RepID=UPI0021A27DB5|nr:transporter substrate-binding domain-containing protein [Sulfitobacter sp. S223]UWR25306.1 transporter substrate-binding domain-containing protein [Sulfitobacter sp. S223]